VKIIDLFSGIGGFSLGFKRAGYHFTEHYFSEIDRHAIANYKYNFPNAKYIGDITSIHRRDFADIDIITFGSPCQDFSLAGKRKGLKGGKSSLIEYAIALVARLRPSVFIWENVKGAFSSNSGADFWAIIQAFANIGDYRLEWQLLNTSWVLPQNRERIYLIGHLAGRSESGVFPIEENDFSFTKEKKYQFHPELCGTLKANGNMNTDDTYIIQRKAKQRPRGKNKDADLTICPTISSNAFQENNLLDGIRRLTEIECERLQGFSDNWTQYGNYKNTIKRISRTRRYKLIGNAVTVDIVELIAKRLKLIQHNNVFA